MLPYLTYGVSVWGRAAKCYIARILKLQKRAFLSICSAYYLTLAIPYVHLANIFPVNLLYFKSVSLLMYDVSNTVLPSNILLLFTPLNQVHEHNT